MKNQIKYFFYRNYKQHIIPQTLSLSDKPNEIYYRRREYPEFYNCIYKDRPDIQTVSEEVAEAISRYSDLKCMGWRDKESNGKYGKYKWLSYHEVGKRLNAFGRGLRKIFPHLQRQNTIGLYGKNCKEIELALFGAFDQVYIYYILIKNL